MGYTREEIRVTTRPIYVRNCRLCDAVVVMRRTKFGRWAAYDEGTNQFHRCPNYDKYRVHSPNATNTE